MAPGRQTLACPWISDGQGSARIYSERRRRTDEAGRAGGGDWFSLTRGKDGGGRSSRQAHFLSGGRRPGPGTSQLDTGERSFPGSASPRAVRIRLTAAGGSAEGVPLGPA